ncbi:MAG: peptidase S10, serine carboxypeptidase [Acidobacteria bacterium OLB17]|nr:MAG: peptidase S10, serine carboxypeptidase [Acidobacteria bacterium OLB17]
MKIMVAAAYYDMATPFYAAEYTVSAMDLDPSLRKTSRSSTTNRAI